MAPGAQPKDSAVTTTPAATRRWTTTQRYYTAHVLTDLFGQWQLVRAWGGRGTQLGRYQITPAESWGHAMELLEAETRRRSKRGYRPAP